MNAKKITYEILAYVFVRIFIITGNIEDTTLILVNNS